MRYRIKIVEHNNGKIIYYPQYNKRIVEDLFDGLIINFVTNWAFTWKNFTRYCDDESLSHVVVYAETLEQAEDFIKKERQRVHDENIKKKAEEIKKITYKYF